MKYRDIVRMIEADGWYWVSTKGSHRKYKHPNKPKFLILPVHNLGADVKIGIEKQILKDAGLR
jgi:predicted RNA binding protein YcfA (HicA-like mRNA interferase family)